METQMKHEPVGAEAVQGSVSLYDPYIDRSIAGICRALNDGHPLLIRLHPGAEFRCADQERLDLEGHAVLVTGYDDREQMFRIQDPFTGAGRDLPYDMLRLQLVDCTLGMATTLSPIYARITDGTFSVGFATAHGQLLGADEVEMRDVKIQAGDRVLAHFDSILAGTNRQVELGAEMSVSVTGSICGTRPLPYEAPFSLVVGAREVVSA